MKKQSLNKQKGMTMISWAVVLAFVGFQFMLAIKIIPVFAEDHTIGGLWKNLGNDASLVGKTPKDIREHILKKMRINSIFTLTAENIKIKQAQGYYVVSIDYEPRGTIIGKLDYIVSIKHEAKIKAASN